MNDSVSLCLLESEDVQPILAEGSGMSMRKQRNRSELKRGGGGGGVVRRPEQKNS